MELSYSSMTKYNTCRRQYWHYKIGETPPDVEQDTVPFRYGKAYHRVQELTNHDRAKFTRDLFDEVCEEYEIDHSLPIPATAYRKESSWSPRASIWTAAQRYYDMHEMSKLQCVAVELPLEAPDFIGYIDCILADVNGNWWICDLKTAASVKPLDFPKLAMDPQLNLYSGFADELAERLNLNPSAFAGCRYRTVTKAKAKLRDEETYEEYSTRVSCKIYDIAVPGAELNPVALKAIHTRVHQSILVSDQKEDYLQNFSACNNFFRPCEYWSQCHGQLHRDYDETQNVQFYNPNAKKEEERCTIKPAVLPLVNYIYHRKGRKITGDALLTVLDEQWHGGWRDNSSFQEAAKNIAKALEKDRAPVLNPKDKSIEPSFRAWVKSQVA